MRNPTENQRTWLVCVLAGTLLLGACSQGGGVEDSAEPDAAPPVSTTPFRGLADSVKGIVSKPVVVIPEGAPLKVRLVPTLSTETHQAGDVFEATLAEPLQAADGKIAAPRGAVVRGAVVESDKGGRVQGVARLAVQLTELETPGGERVRITTSSVRREARPTKKKDAQKVGIGAGVGAAIGAVAGGGKGAAIGAASGAGAGTGVVLATRGEPAVIPSESVLEFTLRNAVELP